MAAASGNVSAPCFLNCHCHRQNRNPASLKLIMVTESTYVCSSLATQPAEPSQLCSSKSLKTTSPFRVQNRDIVSKDASHSSSRRNPFESVRAKLYRSDTPPPTYTVIPEYVVRASESRPEDDTWHMTNEIGQSVKSVSSKI